MSSSPRDRIQTLANYVSINIIYSRHDVTFDMPFSFHYLNRNFKEYEIQQWALSLSILS